MSTLWPISRLLVNNTKLLLRFQSLRHSSDIGVGATASLTKRFTADDVRTYAELSGDSNPLHLEPDYCSQTKFGKPVVHGMLTNGLVSAVFGTVLPGPGTVIVEQTINFTKPLYVGEEVCAEVTVVDIKRRFIYCKYVCRTPEGKEVVNGTAKLVKL